MYMYTTPLVLKTTLVDMACASGHIGMVIDFAVSTLDDKLIDRLIDQSNFINDNNSGYFTTLVEKLCGSAATSGNIVARVAKLAFNSRKHLEIVVNFADRTRDAALLVRLLDYAELRHDVQIDFADGLDSARLRPVVRPHQALSDNAGVLGPDHGIKQPQLVVLPLPNALRNERVDQPVVPFTIKSLIVGSRISDWRSSEKNGRTFSHPLSTLTGSPLAET